MSKNQMFKHETCEKSIKALRGLNLGQLTLTTIPVRTG